MYLTCGAQLDGGTEKVEIVPTCMNSHDFLSSFPSCKPVVVALDKQMLMFGLLHMSCIVTVRILVGSLVVIALRYSSEMLRKSPALQSAHVLMGCIQRCMVEKMFCYILVVYHISSYSFLSAKH